MPVALTISFRTVSRGQGAQMIGPTISNQAVSLAVSRVLLRYAQVAAPVAPQGGGSLRRSLVAGNLLGATGVYGFKTGIWTAEGTRRHNIPLAPKPPGRWLKFEWRGRTVFFKQVNHPRYQGTRWTRRAVQAARQEVELALVLTGRRTLQYVVA